MSKISVVIACVNGLPSIGECLRALEEERSGFDVEIVVVNCCKDGTAKFIKDRYPHVTLIDMAERRGIPELRAIGMAHATGDVIVIIEDHVIVLKNWFAEILKAHQLGYEAVGGAVENGSVDRLVDWAVFLCEYSHTMLPIPHGEVKDITGNNVSYKRELLEKIDESIKRNYWEFFLHEEMRRIGAKFLSVPSIVVSHKKEFGFFYFILQRYHYSRSFAGMRRERVPWPKRGLYLFCSPLLVVLLIWRIAQQVIRKRRYYKEFALSLPVLGIFMISYAVGEFVGYLLGSGQSLLKVE
jgi:GT2 family glycosyltransferase